MDYFQHDKQKNRLEWKQLALTVIDNATDVIAVLNVFKRRFYPNPWSGSLAEILQKRLTLISQLKDHKNSDISIWACNEEKIFVKEIEQRYQYENERKRTQNERFEY
jgi:hypothetical protein